jgi:tripartite-type tricarboxylate transporter receptor subunit TctC
MIAVTGDTRARVLPDIPTFKEAGYPDLTVDVAYFLLAAKGTPQPVVDKLAGAIDKALQDPKIKETLLAQGIEEKQGGPGEVGAYLAAEVRRWSDIVKAFGARHREIVSVSPIDCCAEARRIALAPRPSVPRRPRDA